MSLSLFFTEFHDAIKEGDGFWILRCWRYLLPLFKASNRTNYSIEAFNLLFSYHFILSKREAAQLLWSRTVNIRGLPGRCVPMDLHMEHPNRSLKECVRALGSNKTATALQRVGKSLGTLGPVIDAFDEENNISLSYGRNAAPIVENDQNMTVQALASNKIFQQQKRRYHKSFKSVTCSILQKVDIEDLLSWIVNHTPNT